MGYELFLEQLPKLVLNLNGVRVISNLTMLSFTSASIQPKVEIRRGYFDGTYVPLHCISGDFVNLTVINSNFFNCAIGISTTTFHPIYSVYNVFENCNVGVHSFIDPQQTIAAFGYDTEMQNTTHGWDKILYVHGNLMRDVTYGVISAGYGKVYLTANAVTCKPIITTAAFLIGEYSVSEIIVKNNDYSLCTYLVWFAPLKTLSGWRDDSKFWTFYNLIFELNRITINVNQSYTDNYNLVRDYALVWYDSILYSRLYKLGLYFNLLNITNTIPKNLNRCIIDNINPIVAGSLAGCTILYGNIKGYYYPYTPLVEEEDGALARIYKRASRNKLLEGIKPYYTIYFPLSETIQYGDTPTYISPSYFADKTLLTFETVLSDICDNQGSFSLLQGRCICAEKYIGRYCQYKMHPCPYMTIDIQSLRKTTARQLIFATTTKKNGYNSGGNDNGGEQKQTYILKSTLPGYPAFDFYNCKNQSILFICFIMCIAAQIIIMTIVIARYVYKLTNY